MAEASASVFANPSSPHRLGRAARQAIDSARASIASHFAASPSDIIFTSGGTEADNLAVIGTAMALGHLGKHIITTSFEHPAVLRACQWLSGQGYEVEYIAPDSNGFIDPSRIATAMRDSTILVSVMYVNNEVGTIQPVQEISRLCRSRGVTFHTDAVQAAGELDLSVGADLIVISGHKIYGPKGTGVVCKRPGTNMNPLAYGGAQERGMRPGTENTAAILGLAAAIDLRPDTAGIERVRLLRDRMQAELMEIHGSRVYGAEPRVASILSMGFSGCLGETLAMRLDLDGIAVGTGSACASGSVEVSHVLRAMGLSAGDAGMGIRISLGRDTTEEEVDAAVEAVQRAVAAIRRART